MVEPTTSGPDSPAAAIGWAILELMGHRRLAGYVTEQEIAGKGFLRLDVYEGELVAGEDLGLDEATATQFYAPAAVYCITPTTQALARQVAAGRRPEPVQTLGAPRPAAPGHYRHRGVG